MASSPTLSKPTVGSAHHRKLKQVFGRAVDIGAEVEHGGETVLAMRHHGGDGGAVDAVHRLEHVARHGHQGAGVAGRDAGMRATLQLRDGHAHGGVALAAQRHFHRVVHVDDLAGLDRAAARITLRVRRHVSQRFGAADEDDFSLWMRRQKGLACGQRDRRAMVATHHVHRQANPLQRRGRGGVGHGWKA
jgi:hypothetical protein